MLLFSLLPDIFLTTSPTSSIWQETALSLVKVVGGFTLNEMALKMLGTLAQMGSGPLGTLLWLPPLPKSQSDKSETKLFFFLPHAKTYTLHYLT